MTKGRWKSNKRAAVPRDVYQEVTDKIIATLDAGVVPWQRGWDQVACGAPMNPTTGRVYRGINNLILGMAQQASFNGDPRWCSYRQALARGWQVRKGETSTMVVFYKRFARGDGGQGREGGSGNNGTDGDRNAGYFYMLRTSRVFHVSQMDNVPVYYPPSLTAAPWQTPEAVETILTNSGTNIIYGGSQACFVPSRDCIYLPPKAAFRSDAAFTYTAFHELSHHAYAAPRLNLSQGGRFGSAAYAFEELVVSIASVNICTVVGIAAEIENTASYIDNWLSVIRDDKKAIFKAAAHAQIVADYILAFHPDYAARIRDADGDGTVREGADRDNEHDDGGDAIDVSDDTDYRALPEAA